MRDPRHFAALAFVACFLLLTSYAAGYVVGREAERRSTGMAPALSPSSRVERPIVRSILPDSAPRKGGVR